MVQPIESTSKSITIITYGSKTLIDTGCLILVPTLGCASINIAIEEIGLTQCIRTCSYRLQFVHILDPLALAEDSATIIYRNSRIIGPFGSMSIVGHANAGPVHRGRHSTSWRITSFSCTSSI